MGQLPVQIATRLTVLMAFDQGENGELVPAFEAREMQSPERAVRTARDMAGHHAGVIAWTRQADPAAGEYGISEVLFQSGTIPDLD